MISQSKLKERLHYDPDTGEWTWINHPWFDSYAGRPVKGSPDKDGYLRVHIDNKAVKLHRLAFLYVLGEIPTEVDHINRDRTDNRWSNLRAAERRENGKNLSKMVTNTSGMPGVSWSKAEQKWLVRVMKDGTREFGGYFTDYGAAVDKRNQMVHDLHEQFGAFH